MAQQADFFGTEYLGANPYGQSTGDMLQRMQMIDQMLQGWSSPPIIRQSGGGQRTSRAYLQPDMPDDGGGGGGGQPWTPPGPPGSPLPSPYPVPPDQPCNNWQMGPNGQIICLGNDPMPPGGGTPTPGQPTPPPAGPTYPGQTLPPTSFSGSGGAQNVNFPPNMFSQNIPPELATLRGSLAGFLNQGLGQRYPMYPGNLTLGADPRALDAASMFRTAGGNIQSLASSMIPDVQNLMGYQAPRVGMPNLDMFLSGGSVPQAASELMGLGQRGPGDVGNYLNFGSGILNAALANNPFLTQNLQNFGSASNTLGNASELMSKGVAGPFYGGTESYLDSTANSFRNLANTGGAPDITAALDAIRQRSNLAIEDDLAGIREQYGARGLGAGSDVSEALARGASRGRADMNTQMSTLVADVMNQAAQRQLGAQSIAPSLASAYAAPYENYMSRLLQGSGLASNIAGQYAGVGAAGAAAGTGMQDALTRMSGVLGQYGATTADATQAGTAALTAAGQLQAGASDRALSAADIMSRFNLGQAGLQNEAAGIRNQAAGMIPGYLNAMTGAAGMGAQGSLDVARYMSALGEGNLARPWEAWQMAQQYPLLGPAVSFMGGQTFAPQQQPIIPSSNTGSQLAGAAITGGSSIITALLMAGMLSSREWKDIITLVRGQDILRAVERINVFRWKYKPTFADKDEHIGPTAEDFRAAFNIGDGKTISFIDAFGVLMAAVRELALELKSLRAQVFPLERTNG